MRLDRLNRPSRWPGILITLSVLTSVLLGALWYFTPRVAARAVRIDRIISWFTNPGDHPEWLVNGGTQCPGAPMLLPTTGFIGVDYGDSFRPGHLHSGYDIFSPDGADNVTPIYAAYDGYLTRESTWRSAVILRHPDFPVIVPGEQIWTYYTHMASADGTQSYISPDFPPGTTEVFVPAGTLLGYQGTWSGNPANPTGLHLHFSIVKSNPDGSYTNETEIANTYDPAPFLGVARNDLGILTCAETP